LKFIIENATLHGPPGEKRICNLVTTRASDNFDELREPQTIARAIFPDAPENRRSVDCFRALMPEMSMYIVVQKCGRPDEEFGSGLYITVRHMTDGSSISINTPALERIGDVWYTDASGKISFFLRRN
jgi:hypothetical protein